MDTSRRKELVAAWKNRCPEMGVVSFRCKATNEIFLGISKDTKADYNSNTFKMLSGNHPNKRMQELWNRYGEDSFEYSVLKKLKYEDPLEDHTDELETLRDECFKDFPDARKIWK